MSRTPPDLVSGKKGLRALVADDSKATRRIFRSIFESMGIEITEASDGVEALRLLEDGVGSFDMIFSDINMPEMDGFELCHRLQNSDWYDGTPLIMVSTLSDASNVMRALKLGADDYIPKPFDREILTQVIGRVRRHD